MTRYAAENFSLRQENRQLRSLESVVKSEESLAAITADLEEAFQRAMETERLSESKSTNKLQMMYYVQCLNTCEYTLAGASSHPVVPDTGLAAASEKLKAQLLQKQSDLIASLQAFEEYKEITK